MQLRGCLFDCGLFHLTITILGERCSHICATVTVHRLKGNDALWLGSGGVALAMHLRLSSIASYGVR